MTVSPSSSSGATLGHPGSGAPAADPRAGAARYPGRSGAALAVIVGCHFMVGLDATVVNIALPDIHRALHFSPTGLAWVGSSYMLAFGGLLLLGGRIGDLLGRRRVFTAGLALFALASLTGGLAPTSGVLLAARAVQGVGAALAAPSALALISGNFPAGRQRDRALGAVAGSYAASLALGLVAGGMLTAWASWRWVMFVTVPIAVAVLALTPLFVDEAPRVPGRFDLPGALLSTGGMLSLIYAFLRIAATGWRDRPAYGLFAAAVVLLTAFAAAERRAEQPLTPLRLLRDRNRSAGYVGLLVLAAPMAGMNFFLTQLLQNVLHFSPLRAGLGFLPMAAGLMAAGGAAAQLLRRFGHRAVAVAGVAMLVAGMLWLAERTDLSTTYAGGVLGPTLLFGAGAGTAFTALNSLILGGISEAESGAGSALLESTQWLGSALGLSVLVTVFGTAGRRAAHHVPAHLAPDEAADYVTVHGMSAAFLAGLAFVAAGLLVALLGVTATGTGAARKEPVGTGSGPAPGGGEPGRTGPAGTVAGEAGAA
ncbi:MFS transporter [Streptomyces sp. NRRL F-5123]|uniref:MFS transporter n=1 Tax=Streptomyces sp. NRRL F-5123 TaxID=1463856 RepID=UPI00099BCFBE|nr:MFS transporter [Streptomyces sp. NRRL F-5123]